MAAEPESVTIVAAGVQGTRRADEDELCALYIRSLLEGRPHNETAFQQLLNGWFATDEYLKTREQFGPRTDWELSIKLNLFDYAIEVTQENGLQVARRHSL